MTSSLPDKLFDGQTGFPTPNAAPEINGCRVFSIPDDEEWFALLMGAVLRLTQEWAWYQNGTMTPAEAAAAWQAIIDDAYARSMFDTCGTTVPIPYWDESSADDADDESDVETQPWYGEIVAMSAFIAEDVSLTFLDNLGIWLIAGFIAYSGQVGAAIAFVPLARKFVLSFKQHSLGGIVTVLVDFLHLADIDTYGVEDGVVNATISIPDDGEDHTLYVMMSDEHNPAVTDPPSIQVIRKRLDETEVTPANLRWNVDCDCVQQSPDGGVTWIDSPTQDPRSSTLFQVPARTGGDPHCDSAQQMHDRVKNMLDAIIASSDVLQAINSVVAIIALFFLELGIIIEAIWAIVSAIFSVGTTTLNAALTDDQYDLLLCIFYCNIGSDGTVTADQFATIKSQVTAQLNTVAGAAINQALDAIGFVGLTNAGALGEVTGDCSACDCGWCFEWDFTTTDGAADGWHIPAGGNGTYTSGTGYVGTFENSVTVSDIFLKLTANFTQVATFSYTYTMTDGCGGNYVQNFRLEYPIDTPIATDNSKSLGTDLTKELAGSYPNVAQVRIDNGSGSCAATNVITKARITGFGTPPVLSDATDCS